MRVVIVGAGGHGQVAADILFEMSRAGSDLTPVGYVDDDSALVGRLLLDLPVVGSLQNIGSIDHDAVIVALGDNSLRRAVSEALIAAGARLVNAVHPRSIVARSANLGMGTMVCAGAAVNPDASVGRGVILNTACTVDHHNRIGDYAHIAPGVHLGGSVRIGSDVLVGIGAVVMPNLSIGSRTVIAAGSVVTKDWEEGVVLIGTPARELRKNSHEMTK